MKKILILLVSLLMLFSFSSCDDKAAKITDASDADNAKIAKTLYALDTAEGILFGSENLTESNILLKDVELGSNAGKVNGSVLMSIDQQVLETVFAVDVKDFTIVISETNSISGNLKKTTISDYDNNEINSYELDLLVKEGEKQTTYTGTIKTSSDSSEDPEYNVKANDKVLTVDNGAAELTELKGIIERYSVSIQNAITGNSIGVTNNMNSKTSISFYGDIYGDGTLVSEESIVVTEKEGQKVETKTGTKNIEMKIVSLSDSTIVSFAVSYIYDAKEGKYNIPSISSISVDGRPLNVSSLKEEVSCMMIEFLYSFISNQG